MTIFEEPSFLFTVFLSRFFVFLLVLKPTAIVFQDVILLINQPLFCYIKHSHFISYGIHSLPVSISPTLTSVVVLHYYTVLFLRPFSSFRPPISNSSMTTRPILLTCPARDLHLKLQPHSRRCWLYFYLKF